MTYDLYVDDARLSMMTVSSTAYVSDYVGAYLYPASMTMTEVRSGPSLSTRTTAQDDPIPWRQRSKAGSHEGAWVGMRVPLVAAVGDDVAAMVAEPVQMVAESHSQGEGRPGQLCVPVAAVEVVEAAAGHNGALVKALASVASPPDAFRLCSVEMRRMA